MLININVCVEFLKGAAENPKNVSKNAVMFQKSAFYKKNMLESKKVFKLIIFKFVLKSYKISDRETLGALFKDSLHKYLLC